MRFPLFLPLLVALTLPAQSQDGAALFAEKRCDVCHSIGPEPAARIGPHLNGVVGRTIGGLDDYGHYSATLLNARDEGRVWDRQTLLRYLKDPGHAFPGTSMAYAGLASRADAEALIDYLAGIDADGGTAR